MATKSISLESPLPTLEKRCLGDRSYEKRKNAALAVEQLVKSLAASANGAASNVASKTNGGGGASGGTEQEQHVVNSSGNNNNNDPSPMISALIDLLSKDFCNSMNQNYRKGGLIGLASSAIGLMAHNQINKYLKVIISPVLQCFADPEPRVRYYACESLYNIIKVARRSILPHFNAIFNGLATLFADMDTAVKNGANLLDGLLKDIVTESEEFSVDEFLPLLQNYIRRTSP